MKKLYVLLLAAMLLTLAACLTACSAVPRTYVVPGG